MAKRTKKVSCNYCGRQHRPYHGVVLANHIKALEQQREHEGTPAVGSPARPAETPQRLSHDPVAFTRATSEPIESTRRASPPVPTPRSSSAPSTPSRSQLPSSGPSLGPRSVPVLSARSGAPSPEPVPATPHAAGREPSSVAAEQARRFKRLSKGNLGQVVSTKWGRTDERMDRFLEVMAASDTQDPRLRPPGTRSLFATARTILKRVGRNLLRRQMKEPTDTTPTLEPYSLPMHPALAETSIGLAIIRDDVHSLQALLALGLNLNHFGLFDYTVLGAAVVACANGILRYLISIRDQIDLDFDQMVNAYPVPGGYHSETAMTTTVRYERFWTFRMLSEAVGGTIPGRTMYNICAYERSLGLIDQLLTHFVQVSPDLTMRDLLRTAHPVSGSTALHAAVVNPEPALLHLILQKARSSALNTQDYQAYLNQRNSSGETAFMIAAEVSQTRSMRRLLREEGVDVNARNLRGRTALWHCARNLDEDAVEMLLNHPCDDGNVTEGDGSPFHALIDNWVEFHRELEERRTSVDIERNYQLQPEPELLFLDEVEERKAQIMRIVPLLRTHGTDPWGPDEHGTAPIRANLPGFPEWNALLIV
ncbi:ankyrin repeat-containing domain protein [Aspergillus avenaceus]|uniref:Ankyrin repeat-containing domain protein n=1 Tax=Aspergillus avenaceus TaxID=36643 RepID=A0A5N6U0W1_ASPAV|nr:ankyrin repeat-containing domain protein [Aspergillus avenaceus]